MSGSPSSHDGRNAESLYLTFPWSSHPVETLNRSSLTPRERKYLVWSLTHPGPRLLSLLGFLTYRQARFSTVYAAEALKLRRYLEEKTKWL